MEIIYFVPDTLYVESPIEVKVVKILDSDYNVDVSHIIRTIIFSPKSNISPFQLDEKYAFSFAALPSSSGLGGLPQCDEHIVHMFNTEADGYELEFDRVVFARRWIVDTNFDTQSGCFFEKNDKAEAHLELILNSNSR